MELRNFLDKADAPVLIDQEGGRVLRLDRRISAGLSTRRGLRRPRAGLGGRAAGLAPAAVEGGFIPAFEFKTKARKLRSTAVQAWRIASAPCGGGGSAQRAGVYV
jgi:hypothetical protein